jgi:hypothetical protein
MDIEETKKFVADTCKTPFQMDLHGIRMGLLKWGFKIVDDEVLSDPDELEQLPLYLVWVECDYGIDLARTNLQNWLHDLREFPWVGSWTFVVKFWNKPGEIKEFEFRVTKYLGNVWKISGLSCAQPRWPTTKFTRIRGQIYKVDEVRGLEEEQAATLPPGVTMMIEEL